MYRLIIISLIALTTLTGCSSDGDLINYGDEGGLGLDLDIRVASVKLSESCSADNTPTGVETSLYLTCEQYKEFMETPPNICDKIIIIDKDGVSITGFYSFAVAHEKCD